MVAGNCNINITLDTEWWNDFRAGLRKENMLRIVINGITEEII